MILFNYSLHLVFRSGFSARGRSEVVFSDPMDTGGCVYVCTLCWTLWLLCFLFVHERGVKSKQDQEKHQRQQVHDCKGKQPLPHPRGGYSTSQSQDPLLRMRFPRAQSGEHEAFAMRCV